MEGMQWIMAAGGKAHNLSHIEALVYDHSSDGLRVGVTFSDGEFCPITKSFWDKDHSSSAQLAAAIIRQIIRAISLGPLMVEAQQIADDVISSWSAEE